jgi:hypothetical protein
VQETSGFVYRLYKTALGRSPKYEEWDREINQLSKNRAEAKSAFASDWVNRAEFVSEYPNTLGNVEFVDKLLRTSTQTLRPEQRKALTDDLNNGKISRAQALANVADNPALVDREYHETFVATAYLNLLKRDADPEGDNYWLRIVKDGASGEADVIRGFLYAQEYRARFGQP